MSGNLFLKMDFGGSPSTDDGTRPYTGSQPAWNNTSIWMDGGPSQTQTKVGSPTTVRVRVSNSGAAAISDVHVDAYVMNPHVGIGTPALALHRLSGFISSVTAGSGAGGGTDPHIAVCEIQDVNLGAIPWTPDAADLVASPDGHLCLIANAYAEEDGAAVPDGGMFDIAGDAHQGQRNIALLPMDGAGGDHIVPFHFQVMPAPDQQQTTLTVEKVLAADALGQGERWLLRSHRDISYVPAVAGDRSRFVVAGYDAHEPVPMAFSHRNLNLKLSVAQEPFESGRRLAAVPQAQPATMSLDFSAEAPGAIQAFDLVQRTVAGRALGALRVLAVRVR